MGNNSSTVETKEPEKRLSTKDEQKEVEEYNDMFVSKMQTLKEQLSKLQNNTTFETYFQAFYARLDPLVGKTSSFNQLQLLIEDCEKSHKEFQDLENCEIIMRDYGERVKEALNIHQTQWRLLRDSSKALNDMKFKIEDTKDSIQDLTGQLNLMDENNQYDKTIITESMSTFAQWCKNSGKIETLANEWLELAQKAEREQKKWKQLQPEIQSKLKAANNPRRLTIGLGIGVGVVVIVAAVAIVVLCPVTAGLAVTTTASGIATAASGVATAATATGAAATATGAAATATAGVAATATATGVAATANVVALTATGVATAATGVATATGATATAITTGVVASVAGIALFGVVACSYSKYVKTSRQFKLLESMSNISLKLTQYMGQTAINGKQIQIMLDKLQEKLVTQNHSKDKIKRLNVSNNLRKIQKVKIELNKIINALDEFDNQCDETIKKIETVQRNIAQMKQGGGQMTRLG